MNNLVKLVFFPLTDLPTVCKNTKTYSYYYAHIWKRNIYVFLYGIRGREGSLRIFIARDKKKVFRIFGLLASTCKDAILKQL